MTRDPGHAPCRLRRWLRRWPGRHEAVAAAAGLGAGALALGPGLADGFVLTYDMVFVPDPPITGRLFGLTGSVPRAVPSDLVIAALSWLAPTDIVQKLVLLAIFGLAAAGVAALVPGETLAPKLAAGTFYVWNPYVYERLVLGHWALLLGYAALPWVVRATVHLGTRRPGGARGLARAFLPAAVGGFMAMIITGVTAVTVSLTSSGRARSLATVCLVVTALSLPWLLPGLLRPAGVPGDPAGVDAFAARADTPLGVLGSLLLLGGIWNREVVPPGMDSWVTTSCRLALLGVALWGYLRLRRENPPYWSGLLLAAAVGLGLASTGITEPGRSVLRWLVSVLPAASLLRDAQQYIAPLALLQAVGLGAAVAAAVRWARASSAHARAGASALGVLGILAPLALLPGLAWGAWGRLDAVHYPAGWGRVRAIAAADPVDGAVLVLPWSSYRTFAWNRDRPLLDPAPRMFDRRVVRNDAVRVGSLTIATEDPVARSLGPTVTSRHPLTPALRTAGVRYVLVEHPRGVGENTFHRRLTGSRLVFDGAHLRLYRVPQPAGFQEKTPPGWAVTVGDLLAVTVCLWSFFRTPSILTTVTPE